jgi:hypothetical protein
MMLTEGGEMGVTRRPRGWSNLATFDMDIRKFRVEAVIIRSRFLREVCEKSREILFRRSIPHHAI